MSATPTTLAAHRAQIARLTRLHGASDPRVRVARRDYGAAQIEAQVERVVAASPPFTCAQIDKIAAILDSVPVESEPVTAETGGASA